MPRSWICWPLLVVLVFTFAGPMGTVAQDESADARFERLVEIATASDSVYGPAKGVLNLDRSSDSYDFVHMTPVAVANFVVHVEVENPLDSSDGAWLHRIGFRIGSEPYFRFQIHSDGTWILKDDSITYATGEVSGLASKSGAWNSIDLAAAGAIGYVSVNGTFLAELPLEASLESGLVSIGGASDEPGAEIGYRNFSVWSLDFEEDSHLIFLDPSETGYVEEDAAVFEDAMANGTERDPEFGPERGHLTVEDEFTIPTEMSSVVARDFIVECAFTGPYDGTEKLWDIGVEFRIGTATPIRFRVESSRYWYLTFGSSDPYQMGYLPELAVDEGDQVTLSLVAMGTKGYVGIDGTYIATIDLSLNMNPGVLMIGTAFDADATVVGSEVPYEDFSVWSLDQ